MIYWAWLIPAFLCGIIVTLLTIRRILLKLFMHRPAWASTTLKSMYEMVEAYRIKKRDL